MLSDDLLLAVFERVPLLDRSVGVSASHETATAGRVLPTATDRSARQPLGTCAYLPPGTAPWRWCAATGQSWCTRPSC